MSQFKTQQCHLQKENSSPGVIQQLIDGGERDNKPSILFLSSVSIPSDAFCFEAKGMHSNMVFLLYF